MRIVCVDDEALIAKNTAAVCAGLPYVDEAMAMTGTGEVLEWFTQNSADVAILDIDMPEMSGLQLAAKIRTICPATKIIFLTGYSQYAVDAFKLRASGYLMKPVTEGELAAEIEYAISTDHMKDEDRVVVRTFGDFEVFVGGGMVTFKQRKCKELLAVLVDRHGASISRSDAFARIYEDRQYDRPMQKQFDAIIRSMRETLREYGIEDIFEMKGGRMRILPEKVSCDLYRFLEGDADAVNLYRGEYMSSYSWASDMEGIITGKMRMV